MKRRVGRERIVVRQVKKAEPQRLIPPKARRGQATKSKVIAALKRLHPMD